jgi:acyl-CoA reductase-like NAD-dependent aldehyde dehydrogenase
MITLEERVKHLEAAIAYQDRRTRRIMEVIKIAAGHLASLTDASNIDHVIDAIKSAAGQLGRVDKKDGDQ